MAGLTRTWPVVTGTSYTDTGCGQWHDLLLCGFGSVCSRLHADRRRHRWQRLEQHIGAGPDHHQRRQRAALRPDDQWDGAGIYEHHAHHHARHSPGLTPPLAFGNRRVCQHTQSHSGQRIDSLRSQHAIVVGWRPEKPLHGCAQQRGPYHAGGTNRICSNQFLDLPRRHCLRQEFRSRCQYYQPRRPGACAWKRAFWCATSTARFMA